MPTEDETSICVSCHRLVVRGEPVGQPYSRHEIADIRKAIIVPDGTCCECAQKNYTRCIRNAQWLRASGERS